MGQILRKRRAVQYDGVDVHLKTTARPIGWNRLSSRFELRHIAGQRGKPALNAVIALDENSNAAAHLASNIADPDFEILGTNAVTASVTYNAEGGLTFTTAGAADDQVILLPHLDTNQTAWTAVTWGTDRETHWECEIATGASITNVLIWAGLKLTNTQVIATDDNAIFFRYDDDVSSGKWVVVSSIADDDVSTVTGITVAVSTRYRLRIEIDAARRARCYINGVLVHTTTALTSTDLKPYIGIENDGGAGAAKVLDYYGQSISRLFGA